MGARDRRIHRRDAILVAILTVATWVVCGIFNVTEMLRRLNAPYERYQLDELPTVLLVLGLGLTWLATRRYQEARQEIIRRKSAEAQLAAALADNRRLAQQYVELQETERKALARELHDELGQYLNVIKLDAVGIRDDSQASQAATHRRASTIVEICNHVHGALATLIRELRPTGLDELGLAAALEHCVATWRPRLPDASLRLEIAGDFSALPESTMVTLYRLVQEALTNVAKHAAASHVNIRLERAGAHGADDDWILASVSDDGVGASPGLPTRGLGLIGMRERVMALQGTLVFTSSPGRGFELSARIPVPPEAAA
ncbi:MAG TPA: sensor histidine kinase [Steroidobacteraceae bacterium]|jgi:signal transduction histidine kinase|nr:sensor histidine kinase [Steroidobacteraceae bacterium]